MEMNEEPSLSKGLFVHKAKGRASPKKQNATFDENQRKQKEFKQIWSKIEKKIMSISASIHKDATSFVLDFVRNCYQNIQTNPAVLLGAIPTIALMMGVNIPDHSSLFHLLSSSLSEEGEFVTSLQGSDCATLPALMQKLLQSVIQQQEEEISIKRVDCTFETLASWYENKVQERGSPRKKRKSNRPSLVIMLEDIEGFPPSTLQDFILICSHYLNRVPIILVLGVATAMVTVHRLLPLQVTSCLAIEVYTSPSATYMLNAIIEEVLIRSDLPFRLGCKVFKFLADTIIFHDFSVSNLSHMLKFCVFEHFFTNPASALMYESGEAQLKIIVNNLPSFQKYASKTSEEKPSESKKKHSHQDTVQALTKGLFLHNKHLSLMLECLYVLSRDLPGEPLGKQRRELYLLFLHQHITDSVEFKNAFKLIKLMSLDELLGRLSKFLDILIKDDVRNYIQNSDSLEAATWILESLLTLREGPQEEVEEKIEKEEAKFSLNIPGKVTRHLLQEHLLKAAKNKPKTKFEKWRDDVTANLEALFRLLPPLGSVPLHEAMYFDDVSAVKAHLNVSPKMTIHAALVDPQIYLQCKCCVLKDKEEETPCTLPSISLAYKIMLEGGQLINIHDWLQSYLSIRGQNQTRTPRKRSKIGNAGDEKMHQAEFFQALSELQMLGIVKPNKRKTDHVARLTWGSC